VQLRSPPALWFTAARAEMRILFPSCVREHWRQLLNLVAVRPDGTGPTRLTHFSGAAAGVIGAVRAADGTHTPGTRWGQAAASGCRQMPTARTSGS
jgi:hypothetical protein